MFPLYRPLAYYVHTCCLDNNFLQTACSCFLAWCDLLDYRTAIPLLPKPNPKHLQMLWLGSQHAAKDALATSLAACVAKMAVLASLLELRKKT